MLWLVVFLLVSFSSLESLMSWNVVFVPLWEHGGRPVIEVVGSTVEDAMAEVHVFHVDGAASCVVWCVHWFCTGAGSLLIMRVFRMTVIII